MLFTALTYLLVAALAIAGLGALLLPVCVWVSRRDALQTPRRAAGLPGNDVLLAETEAMLARAPAR